MIAATERVLLLLLFLHHPTFFYKDNIEKGFVDVPQIIVSTIVCRLGMIKNTGLRGLIFLGGRDNFLPEFRILGQIAGILARKMV